MERRLRQLFVINGLLLAGLAIILLIISQNVIPDSWLGQTFLAAIWLAALFWLAWQLASLVLNPMQEFAALPPEEWDSQAPYPELLPFIEALQQRQVQKEENIRQRQEFSANVSHELKTPLTSISGYAEMIETGMAQEKDIKEFAGKIHAEAGRLISLIRDILKLSELDEPQAAAELDWLPLLPIAQDTAGLLAFNAQRAGIDLRVEGTYSQVFAQRDLLEELIYNLCDNAIRYNHAGGWVRISVRDEAGGVLLTVSDNGIGIPPEHQERIFERFYRADKSRSKASGGTGLGLAIVKHIVLQLGAKLSLQSQVGQGTSISVWFAGKNTADNTAK